MPLMCFSLIFIECYFYWSWFSTIFFPNPRKRFGNDYIDTNIFYHVINKFLLTFFVFFIIGTTMDYDIVLCKFFIPLFNNFFVLCCDYNISKVRIYWIIGVYYLGGNDRTASCGFERFSQNFFSNLL